MSTMKAVAIFLLMLFGAGGGCIYACNQIGKSGQESEAARHRGMSPKVWEDHKALVRGFADLITKSKDPFEMNSAASRYETDKWVTECRLKGCNALKAFARVSRKATDDGRIIPSELKDLKFWRLEIERELSEGDALVAAKAP